MNTLLTPKQVARALGVSEASLKRWCDKGLLAAQRTAGGHRRLPVAEVVQFLRRSGRTPVQPELLGLPPTTGHGERAVARARAQTLEALLAGREETLHQLALNLYLAGYPIWDICDRIIAPVFRQLGHQWQEGRVEVYRERRACEVCLRVLWELRRCLPPAPVDAPLALGGTLSGDPYHLPTTMVELVLREAGWQAQSLGVGLPAASLRAALREARPRLFWLSVSAFESLASLRTWCAELYEAARAAGALLVVGGRVLTPEVRRQLRYTAFCDCLGHLVSFLEGLSQPRRRRPS
jgi:excisionase family DNA binding protein